MAGLGQRALGLEPLSIALEYMDMVPDCHCLVLEAQMFEKSLNYGLYEIWYSLPSIFDFFVWGFLCWLHRAWCNARKTLKKRQAKKPQNGLLVTRWFTNECANLVFGFLFLVFSKARARAPKLARALGPGPGTFIGKPSIYQHTVFFCIFGFLGFLLTSSMQMHERCSLEPA